MSNRFSRIVVYTKDVQKMTGCSSKTAQSLLRKIRGSFQKNKKDLITIGEFCAYTKWDEKLVRECLTD